MLHDILARGHMVMALDGVPRSSEFTDDFNPMARFVRGSVLGQGLVTRLTAGIFTVARLAQARWVKNAGARQSQRFATLKILKNLPPRWLK